MGIQVERQRGGSASSQRGKDRHERFFGPLEKSISAVNAIQYSTESLAHDPEWRSDVDHQRAKIRKNLLKVRKDYPSYGKLRKRYERKMNQATQHVEQLRTTEEINLYNSILLACKTEPIQPRTLIDECLRFQKAFPDSDSKIEVLQQEVCSAVIRFIEGSNLTRSELLYFTRQLDYLLNESYLNKNTDELMQQIGKLTELKNVQVESDWQDNTYNCVILIPRQGVTITRATLSQGKTLSWTTNFTHTHVGTNVAFIIPCEKVDPEKPLSLSIKYTEPNNAVKDFKAQFSENHTVQFTNPEDNGIDSLILSLTIFGQTLTQEANGLYPGETGTYIFPLSDLTGARDKVLSTSPDAQPQTKLNITYAHLGQKQKVSS